MIFERFISYLPCVAAMLMPVPVLADNGHDHGAGTTSTGAALPRFAAVSDAFELVGILDGKQLTLYLDRAADNSPVKGAKLELEIGGAKIELKPHGEGEFMAVLGQAPQPGVLPVSASVRVGAEADLLAGELDLHAAHATDATHASGWKRYVPWLGGVIALIAAVLWSLRLLARRRARAGSIR